jgi:hypothetical protein
MQPTPELIDELYRERILRARRTPPEEKLLDGFCLFDLAREIMMYGIRKRYPEAAEQRVCEILDQRLELLRRLETA